MRPWPAWLTLDEIIPLKNLQNPYRVMHEAVAFLCQGKTSLVSLNPVKATGDFWKGLERLTVTRLIVGMALLGMLTSANVRAATGNDLPTVNFANLAGSFGIAVLEGGTRTTNLAILTISLSAQSQQDVTVFWKTSDSTATAASGDYEAVSSGNLKFPAGTTTLTITNLVYGDSRNEADEKFFVILTGASNAVIGGSTTSVTIINDDAVPIMSVSNTGRFVGGRGIVAIARDVDGRGE